MNFLSFLKTNDIYDPDRIDTDLELIRRYYLKHGSLTSAFSRRQQSARLEAL